MTNESRNRVNLRQLFLGLQREMIAQLETARANIPHATIMGKVTEDSWLNLLKKHLPSRYMVSGGLVIDVDGNVSDQIDVIVFDRHYSPLVLKQEDVVYIPAESVYAVFEVKPEISKSTIEYAGKKARSVRRLRRTSVPIPYAAGTYDAKEPFAILGGILALKCSWTPPFGESFEKCVGNLAPDCRLDLGCAIGHGSFLLRYPNEQLGPIEYSANDTSLVFFVVRLLGLLQGMGTVSAIDFEQYGSGL